MKIECDQLSSITFDVCQSMLGLEMSPVEVESAQPQTQFAACVLITGSHNSMIEVATSPDAAVQIASTMFAREPEGITVDDVSDAVSEVANMIGGNLKGFLGGDCQLSIPYMSAKPTQPEEGAAVAAFDIGQGVVQVIYKDLAPVQA